VRIHITVLDAIECKISKEQAKHLIPCLSYKSTFWRKGQFKKVNQAYRKQVFSFKNKEDWFFYTGHLDRVLNFCNNKGWETKLKIHDSFNVPWVEPNIPGLTLRKDQKRAVKIALAAQRGVIKEPTGTGKTILQLGIMSAFADLLKKKETFSCLPTQLPLLIKQQGKYGNLVGTVLKLVVVWNILERWQE